MKFIIFLKHYNKKASLVTIFFIPFALYGCHTIESLGRNVETKTLKTEDGKIISEDSVAKEQGHFNLEKKH
jgi:hypothetical protein